ncbi:DNA helicase Pif1-like, partial [Cinara cedri]
MLQVPSAETFSKQLLDIGDGKVAIDETGYVKLPTDFCTIADSQDTLTEQIFPDVHTQVCDDSEAVNFPTECLNSLDLPGMPPHNLQLKVGSAIILLRNLNPTRLCN